MRSIALLALAVISVGSSVAQTAPSSSPVKQEAWSVRGLQAPAEIVVDQWGVPHIFAGSARDALFFLQGYNAARDRLWQVDLWRKRWALAGSRLPSVRLSGAGQGGAPSSLSGRHGEGVECLFARREGTSVTAFTDGINAYVAEVRIGTKPLPLEFKLTGSTPEDWKPEDVLRIPEPRAGFQRRL